ncbi:MAG: hypothetical protein OHK0029_03430 [Armatimonadaceae bacterium]
MFHNMIPFHRNNGFRPHRFGAFARCGLSLALLLGIFCALLPLARAQSADDFTAEEYAEMGEAGPIVREIRPLKDKTVVFIFDISGSMKADNMLRRARQVMAEVVKNGLNRGDEAVLFTFGPSYDTFRKKIAEGTDRRELLDKIPFEPGQDAGTNIRKPHHDALKILAEAENRPGIIIVLTDSYNDEPKPESESYGEYKNYYVPGQLSKYPKTPENTAYENLLERLVVSGQVKQYGVGVQFAESGRPIERVPQAAPPPVEAPRSAAAATTRTTAPPPKTDYTWVWIAVGALALVGTLAALAPLFKPVSLRIRSGAKDAKDFQISGSQTVRIGGDNARFATDAFGLPGISATVATIRASGGKMTLLPEVHSPAGATAKAPTAPAQNGAPVGVGMSNEKGTPRVYHNGLVLEAPAPLLYGDEIRVTVSQADGTLKEYRLKVEDPRADLR